MTERIEDLVARLGEQIGSSGVTLAAAESCTGGMLCGAITANPAVSGSLERGMVVYSPNAKADLLGLDLERVESCDGVDRELTIDMANATLGRSRASIAIAIAGFAGPREKGEEVGLVHFAIATSRGEIIHREHHFGDPGRETVCERAVETALSLLIDVVGTQRAAGPD